MITDTDEVLRSALALLLLARIRVTLASLPFEVAVVKDEKGCCFDEIEPRFVFLFSPNEVVGFLGLALTA